jgi:hypothetical protein
LRYWGLYYTWEIQNACSDSWGVRMVITWQMANLADKFIVGLKCSLLRSLCRSIGLCPLETAWKR